jgi:hypothetical protein
LPAICDFTRAFDGRSILLDIEDGLVGLHDTSPPSPYRVDPSERSEDTIQRDLGGGITYIDRGGYDVLHMTPGSQWQPTFRAPDARLLAVEIVVPVTGLSVTTGTTSAPLIEIDTGAGTAPVPFGQGLEAGWARVVVPVEGVGDDATIRGLAEVDLLRVTAFEPLPGVSLPVDQGPVRFDPATLCPTP